MFSSDKIIEMVIIIIIIIDLFFQLLYTNFYCTIVYIIRVSEVCGALPFGKREIGFFCYVSFTFICCSSCYFTVLSRYCEEYMLRVL
uniref:Uncharacterized protein n=1 Tax=Octopus bimaculoides TaxID=37653 RepID=A0A0L8H0A8_OCTBM